MSLMALLVMAHSTPENFERSYVTLVMFVSGLITVYMWIHALLKLARRHAMFSFVSILLLQLVGLGIVGMAGYALSGPEEKLGYVTRPSVT